MGDSGDLDERLDAAIASARCGAEAGFTEIYVLLAGKVTGYLAGRGVIDSADVTNDVFLGAFQNFGSFEGAAVEFRSWLFAIAWNKAVDWQRVVARRPRHAHEPDAAIARIAGGDVQHDAMGRLGNDVVDDMLAVLTDDQRDVILLRVIADLSLDEVAMALSKPVGAVKSLQHRALATLQRENFEQAVSHGAGKTNTGVR